MLADLTAGESWQKSFDTLRSYYTLCFNILTVKLLTKLVAFKPMSSTGRRRVLFLSIIEPHGVCEML